MSRMACARTAILPVAFGSLALHQLAAAPQQLAQIAERRRRDEALGDQAVPDQIGDPLGILHIRLAAGHIADVAGIADDQIEMSFQHGIDWPPVDAGAFHADMRHPRRREPVPQDFEVARHRPERAHLLGRSIPGRADQKTRNDRLLVHVHPQHRSIITRIIASCHQKATATPQVLRDTATRAPRSRGRQRMVPLCGAGRTAYRGRKPPQRFPASTRSPVPRLGINRPPPPPFSFIMARRRRWLAA